MKNEELKEVLRLHRLWLDGDEGGKRADLCDADLVGVDLRGVDLRAVELSRSDLRDADLNGANLRWSYLRRANLSRSYLSDAYLIDANLGEADLSWADLQGADLRGADLSEADLSRADLRGAIGDGKRIKTIIGMKYHINIWDDMMAIGCQQHRIEDWFEFSEDRIAKMDSRALEWWSAKKDLIRQLAIEFGAMK